MPRDDGLNLDLNLLRVFLAVVEAGGVTKAAARLYVTQPAVSAALRRLTDAVGAPLFVRRGRGLALSARGARLAAEVKPLLGALVTATLSPPAFDPRTSERTLRLGLSDSMEAWLAPQLISGLLREAPGMRLVVLPVQFRVVGEALGSGAVDAAVTVADELPRGVRRQALYRGTFVCLYDPRARGAPRRMTADAYFSRPHLVVSYNGDLRGIVEDALGRERDVRCSVSSFWSVGAIVDGTPLVATVPRFVAERIVRERPHLRMAKLPLAHVGAPIELLWPASLDDDPACRYLRERIVESLKGSGSSARAAAGGSRR